MPHYLHQVAYSTDGWGALLKKPQDRIEAVRPAIEKLGGKVKTAYFAFGDYDVILITEMPDNVSAAGIAMAFAGGGSCKSVQTTPLLSVEEALDAMKRLNNRDIIQQPRRLRSFRAVEILRRPLPTGPSFGCSMSFFKQFTT